VFNFRKARLFLELRQLDVSRDTGISITKIAAAERGEYLHPHERGILKRFYIAALRDYEESERVQQPNEQDDLQTRTPAVITPQASQNREELYARKERITP
jgi:hypothetical protein